MIRFILIVIVGLIISGCVGTIQESTTPSNLQDSKTPVYFNFPGITTARPIAHDKIELEFFPATGGADISYKLFINGTANAIPIDPQSLYSTLGGRYIYTVEGLTSNQQYKFKLTAANNKLNSVSSGEMEAYATTFDNRVAQFHGISKLSLVPGQSDNAALVDWIASPMSGIFTAGPYDVAHYEITVISEYGGAANLNNPTYGGTDKRKILVPTPPLRATPLSNPSQFSLGTLSPNTRYYVQVRAINTLYQNFVENLAVTVIPVNREVNTRFMTIKTDPGGSLFDFDYKNVVLTNATGMDAFDKINVFWKAGSGSFHSYRIFARKYDGSGDATVDDKLTEAMMQSMTTSGNYTSVPSTDTSRRLTGLDNQAWYQVKVVLCKTAACPVSSSDSNGGIISEIKAIQVKPTLASFSGINSIEPPGQYNEKDVVRLRFDAPIMNTGYANILEFYCVNPADKTQMVKFTGTSTITGSPVAVCNGLSLTGVVPSMAVYTAQKVKGLITDGAHEYCFAATPAITINGANIRLASMIVRCSFPEVLPPSLEQFPGVKNFNTPTACQVSGATAKVGWNLPTGGIYSGFKVFWKEKNSVAKFSYKDGIDAVSGYSSSADLAANILEYTATGLMPGKTYQMGVLAITAMTPPASMLYSEYNLNVVDCVIPLPIASFKGFTRIFAVGPKLDGRYPNDTITKAPSASSAIFEAIDVQGIPYEVAMDSEITPNTSINYTLPPGRDAGAAFTTGFDGAPETASNLSMSKKGIVSLAWEEVGMNYPEADTFFQSNMPSGATPRTGRRWGYKVYRSADNKLTWQDLTATHGNVYSLTYSYMNRPGASTVNKKMAFFTDYSVSALSEIHDSTNARDVDRARVYYYRIVPMFDGQALTYSNTNRNIVKVTLPPANMALVHRWMANRNRCLELDKNIDINNNYTCQYNGVGASPKGIPYQTNQTVLDQMGDLLVDRNELGCRYTRGDKVADPTIGSSYFNRGAARRDPDDLNSFPTFRGFRSIGTTEDSTTPFKGCVGQNSASRGNGTATDYATGFTPDYQHFLQGDCVGAHREIIATNVCNAQDFADGFITTFSLVTPGADLNYSATDCSAGNSYDPRDMRSKYMGFWAPNKVMQSEFLGVFYNTFSDNISSTQYGAPVEGPAVGSLTTTRSIDTGWGTGSGRMMSQCSINLASIDGTGTGYMKPRWVGLNDLSGEKILFKGSHPDLITKTVAEITEVDSDMTEPLTFYNGVEGDGTNADWKVPSGTLLNSNRYRQTTRLGRILSSNSAKLPPIGRINSSAAYSLCSNYWVQVGSASENGTFAAEGLPVSKRPLRRQESVTASAWPESTDLTKLDSLERSTSAGSCNSRHKNVTGDYLGKGDLLSNRITHFTNTLGGVPLVTGSSPYNGIYSNTESLHTSQCVSRYGVQDIVGNNSEYNSEKIFCDYSQDQSFMGPVAGGWGGGELAENQDDGGPDLSFFNDNDQRNHWGVLKQGTIGGISRGFEMKFRDGSSSILNAKPWVRISTDSGYCSVVDNNPAARTGGNNFADITGVWKPIFLPGGALNTTMISKTQKDMGSVNTWRNGDGRFLDFGPNGLAPAINRQNSMSLTTDHITVTDYTVQGKYFNPIIGFPLKCSTASCKDPLISQFNDNTSVSTTGLLPNIKPTDDVPAFNNFPIGNSQVTHPGISDFSLNPTGHETLIIPTNGYNPTAVDYLVTAVEMDDKTTKGNPVIETVNFPSAFTPGDTIEYYRLVWTIPRGSELSISSGGRSPAYQTGRYSAEFDSTFYMAYGSAEISTGVRCATLINQD